uniref:Uncharacterized protein n=1 Tax=Rhizophora mucronata TaxID=61149 RepID=A0A2P2JWZ1_RHIMU
MDNKIPSKLQGTMKEPDLIPSKAFLATSSAFIILEDPAITLVSCGLLLFSSTRPGVSVSGGKTRERWMLSAMTSCCNASPSPRRPNLLAEYAVYP